jgi:hypothetical protein
MLKARDTFLFLAEPFGFGPVSSSIAIARDVKQLDPEQRCILLGSGTSYQLAAQSGVFDQVCFTEDLSPATLAAHNITIDNSRCVAVANTYPDGVDFAKSLGIPCFFVDTLFWMWKELPINPSDVEMYFIEHFHCAPSPVSQVDQSDKFRIVRPLINLDAPARPVPHPFLLVSLGGIDTSLYDFPVFYQKLIEHVSTDSAFQDYTVLVCGGGKRFRDNEFAQYEHRRLSIGCLAPHDYISYLRSADIVLASAGLHSFYENYFLGKNVMFLPPQSYSQYLQLKFIMQDFRGVVATNFEQLEVTHTLREKMPDLERINEMRRVAKLLGNEQTLRIFFDALSGFCSGQRRTDWSVEENGLGEGLPGPLAIAQEILSYAG